VADSRAEENPEGAGVLGASSFGWSSFWSFGFVWAAGVSGVAPSASVVGGARRKRRQRGSFRRTAMVAWKTWVRLRFGGFGFILHTRRSGVVSASPAQRVHRAEPIAFGRTGMSGAVWCSGPFQRQEGSGAGDGVRLCGRSKALEGITP
jgi:hypothetical protein